MEQPELCIQMHSKPMFSVLTCCSTQITRRASMEDIIRLRVLVCRMLYRVKPHRSCMFSLCQLSPGTLQWSLPHKSKLRRCNKSPTTTGKHLHTLSCHPGLHTLFPFERYNHLGPNQQLKVTCKFQQCDIHRFGMSRSRKQSTASH